ncbi:hypothetical protein PPL_08977 [Heterostelium album PN500]|uniref:Endo-beta-1,2-glucanase SGL domain-containing protein n=1 Tax=Heterostelium pallidum (strain ATCC 26659 / Pp 5 / PN500) TaxID=670386 RepID=D3BK96_HETP5|nr:hypothetical protein PPL_08977 [Heterostelium album PN500]EFA78326.1 hypothetical protein PPL_08977 [Heterostelium album PN500]|eukprot:XP_020430451.1 hypothetical protein PPL_08977 [Heterostelium album PN500]
MKVVEFLVFLSIVLVGVVVGRDQCRFASLYTQNQLYNDPTAQQSFINNVLYWEGNFHQHLVGINAESAYTYDGHTLDYATGELHSPLHTFSAPSKESIHLGMMANALTGKTSTGFDASIFFHQSVDNSSSSDPFDNVITTLTRKITTYENFNKQFPGYGGFMPWVSVNNTGIYPLPGYWSERVPGLDNGEMIWGMYAVIQALKAYSDQAALLQRYQAYLDLLTQNAKTIFYTNPGWINAVTHIDNIYAQPTPSNYQNDCNCFLDDPYEGEMLTVYMDLYCQWDNITERDQLWINKRALLQSVEFQSPEGNITVQRGWWFSSHEQWKYLMLPYRDIDINRRVFENGERARTYFSNMNQYPGLFASVNNVTQPNTYDPNYDGATGIQEIAFESIQTNDVFTPYGSYPLFLVQDVGMSLGLAWYYNMISAPAMQNQYGSTESGSNQGDLICPLLTWDSKITTVLAMMGGAVDLNRNGLTVDNKINRFYQVIEREWTLAFPVLNGENIDFQLPPVSVPKVLNDFTTCSN